MLHLVISLMHLLDLLVAEHVGFMQTLVQSFNCFMEGLVVDNVAQLHPDLLLDNFIDFHHIHHDFFDLVDGSVHIFEVEVVGFDDFREFDSK